MDDQLSWKNIASFRDALAGITTPRSGHWPKVEHEFLSLHSVCEACGTKEKLNAHHMKPFHLYPALELDPSNLITLCMDKDCHILLGHGDNWKAYNPNVIQDVATVHGNINMLNETAELAKKERVFV